MKFVVQLLLVFTFSVALVTSPLRAACAQEPATQAVARSAQLDLTLGVQSFALRVPSAALIQHSPVRSTPARDEHPGILASPWLWLGVGALAFAAAAGVGFWLGTRTELTPGPVVTTENTPPGAAIQLLRAH